MKFQIIQKTILESWRLFNIRWSGTLRFLRYVLAFSMGAFGLIGCNTAYHAPTDEESLAIYQLVIREIYKSQDGFLGYPDKSNLYIVRTIINVDDSRAIDTANSLMLAKAIESGLTQHLADLPSKIEFVDKFEQIQLDPKTQSPAKGVVLSLGKIQLQQDEAFVYVGLYLAPLAGIGKTYVAQKKNGAWVITGTKGQAWMS